MRCHYCHVFSVSQAQPSPAHLFDVSEHQYNGNYRYSILESHSKMFLGLMKGF